MKGQVNLYYIISSLLLVFSSLCVAAVGLFQPSRTELLLGLLLFQLFCIVFSFYVSYRFLLLPLLHLKKTTSAVLASLDEQVPEADSTALLDRFQAIIDREYDMRAAFRQAELDALQSQINPHFLYNTLECIRGQAIVDGNRPIADMARALSEFFRYSISRATHLVTVEDGIVSGGFGESVKLALARRDERGGPGARVLCLGYPDEFIEHASRGALLRQYGLDAPGIARSALEWVRRD